MSCGPIASDVYWLGIGLKMNFDLGVFQSTDGHFFAREDLIKFVKKQMVILQKTRAQAESESTLPGMGILC